MEAVFNQLNQWAGDAGGLLDLIRLGGPVVVILIVMSILAVAIFLLKLGQFRGSRVFDRKTPRAALNIYRIGSPAEAASVAGRSPNPAAQVLVRAIRGKHRSDLPAAMVREEVLRYGADQLERLRSHFRALEVIASLAPLLGLFGTVLGMIEAFRALEQAGAQVNPAVLSGGIWEALLTTAVGLAVAMPVIVALNWLERAVDRLAHEMDNVVTQIFTADLSQPLQPRAEPDARTAAHQPPSFTLGE